FVKLLVSRHAGYAFDRLRAVWQRYQGVRPNYAHAFWTPKAQISDFRAGARLVVALPGPANVHWGVNGWGQVTEESTTDSGLGFHAASLDVDGLKPGGRVNFTWRWQGTGEWHGQDYEVSVSPS